MLSNGVDGPREVKIIDIVEKSGVNRSRHTAAWKGFFISESQSTVSKLAVAGGILVGSLCTCVGLQQRTPAIFITFPIMTLIAEAAYFSRRAYHYFKTDNPHFEESGDADDRVMPEGAKCVHEERLVLLENNRTSDPGKNLTAVDFFKSFETNYFGSGNTGFEYQVELFQVLKDKFPDYFSRHEKVNMQSMLEDKEQCKIVLEGIFNCYRQAFNKKSEYRILATIDDGDCLYDALWQGLSLDMQEDLLQQYQEKVDEQGETPHLALKALLCEVADKEKYRAIILKNGEELLEATSYNSIDGYKCLIKDKGKFWGRHNIEGKILAEELGLNLTLIAGCDYNQQAGFTCWDDERIYVSKTARSTLYIENSHQHYSAAQKQVNGSSNEVSTT